MKRDYGKPIGWWCEHGLEGPGYVDPASICRGCIPVFVVIPEHLRPETHDETHECVEVVTMTDDDGDCSHHSADVNAHPNWDDCADSHWCHSITGAADPSRINDLAEATARARR